MKSCAVCCFPLRSPASFHNFLTLVEDYVDALCIIGDIAYLAQQDPVINAHLMNWKKPLFVVPAYVDQKDFTSTSSESFGNLPAVMVPASTRPVSNASLVLLDDVKKEKIVSKKHPGAKQISLQGIAASVKNKSIIFSLMQPQLFAWQEETLYRATEYVQATIDVNGKQQEVTYNSDDLVPALVAEELSALGFAFQEEQIESGSKKITSLFKKPQPFLICPHISQGVSVMYSWSGKQLAEQTFQTGGVLFVGSLDSDQGVVIEVNGNKLKYSSITV